jgi:hypothetical protein
MRLFLMLVSHRPVGVGEPRAGPLAGVRLLPEVPILFFLYSNAPFPPALGYPTPELLQGGAPQARQWVLRVFFLRE